MNREPGTSLNKQGSKSPYSWELGVNLWKETAKKEKSWEMGEGTRSNRLGQFQVILMQFRQQKDFSPNK